MNLSAFKAYDIRGRIPDEINEDLALAVGRAYAGFVKPKRVVVGHDMRLTSPALAAALTRGLTETGVDVYDIGQCGTEGVYFATSAGDGAGGQFDGGIMVTASHNPPDYNGMKFVREGSRPISARSTVRACSKRGSRAYPTKSTSTPRASCRPCHGALG
jgi:phosphomannomutase